MRVSSLTFTRMLHAVRYNACIEGSRHMGKLVFLKKSDVQPTVEQYCNAHSYDSSKLDGLMFDSGSGSEVYCAYCIPSNVVPNGLMNDLATQPTPILFVIQKGNNLVVEETEYTKSFFAD
jgi:hypothetical protein